MFRESWAVEMDGQRKYFFLQRIFISFFYFLSALLLYTSFFREGVCNYTQYACPVMFTMERRSHF